MFGKMVLRLAVCIFFISFYFSAQAQPLLPDMIGASQNGINLITWTCQYNGVKSIAVQRSNDSVYNYTTIGYVKVVAKGQQAFLDGHAKGGDNWYRLCIVFGSDLTWYSNSLKLKLDSSWVLKQKSMPSNDSLQKFAANVKITEAAPETQPKPAAAQPPKTTTPAPTPGNKVTTITKPADTAKGVKPVVTPGAPAKTTTTTSTTQPQSTQPGVKVVLDSTQHKRDSTRKMVVTTQPPPAQPKIVMPKIVTDTDPSLYIKSQYVFTNPYTGHVNIEIPDARKFLYSIKFMDIKNHVIMEVPRIVDPVIIIDKRNFQHKGVYKFELMKEHARLESGNISIY